MAVHDAEPQRAEERMLRALHEAEEVREVHDPRHVRIRELDEFTVDEAMGGHGNEGSKAGTPRNWQPTIRQRRRWSSFHWQWRIQPPSCGKKASTSQPECAWSALRKRTNHFPARALCAIVRPVS